MVWLSKLQLVEVPNSLSQAYLEVLDLDVDLLADDPDLLVEARHAYGSGKARRREYHAMDLPPASKVVSK